MTTPNQQKPQTEEAAVLQATTAYLKEKKGYSDETAGLYARLIAAEERERLNGTGERRAELRKDLADIMKKTRQEFRNRFMNEQQEEQRTPDELNQLLELMDTFHETAQERIEKLVMAIQKNKNQIKDEDLVELEDAIEDSFYEATLNGATNLTGAIRLIQTFGMTKDGMPPLFDFSHHIEIALADMIKAGNLMMAHELSVSINRSGLRKQSYFGRLNELSDYEKILKKGYAKILAKKDIFAGISYLTEARKNGIDMSVIENQAEDPSFVENLKKMMQGNVPAAA